MNASLRVSSSGRAAHAIPTIDEWGLMFAVP
jgi:hypothetical protein